MNRATNGTERDKQRTIGNRVRFSVDFSNMSTVLQSSQSSAKKLSFEGLRND